MPHGRLWRAIDPALCWYERPDEAELVVFSPKSGNLHLLTSAARPVLEAMAIAPCAIEDIAELLHAAGSTDAPNQSRSIVAALDAAELIEPAS